MVSQMRREFITKVNERSLGHWEVEQTFLLLPIAILSPLESEETDSQGSTQAAAEQIPPAASNFEVRIR